MIGTLGTSIAAFFQFRFSCRGAHARCRDCRRVKPAFLLAMGSLLTLLLPVGIIAGEGDPALRPLLLDRPADLPPARFPFRSYGAELGLANLAVRRIAQDTTGFLWIGTEDGLYRYDGDRFARFDLRNGLPSTWIIDIFANPEGSLWVCTLQGLAVRRGEQFHVFSPEASGLPPGPCHAVARDGRGTIWVAHREGLFSQGCHRHYCASCPIDRAVGCGRQPRRQG
jgi:hypothetical protein